MNNATNYTSNTARATITGNDANIIMDLNIYEPVCPTENNIYSKIYCSIARKMKLLVVAIEIFNFITILLLCLSCVSLAVYSVFYPDISRGKINTLIEYYGTVMVASTIADLLIYVITRGVIRQLLIIVLLSLIWYSESLLFASDSGILWIIFYLPTLINT